MQYGIYYAYWEKDWQANFLPYIEKCKKLGFDVLEIACGGFDREGDDVFRELRVASESCGIKLTGGYGPRPEHNLAAADTPQVEKAFEFYANIFRKMEIAGIDRIGGALYSYWPVDFSRPIDKSADTLRSIKRMRRLADMALDHGITLNMESLNRFEGYMINEASECIRYVEAVDKPNVKVMLDTFHMNIEEDSPADAICKCGPLLGHFHVGEANRRCPNMHGHIDWTAIGAALHAIDYDGCIVMEPFVRMGGQVGRDVSLWRDLSGGATDDQLDEEAANSVKYLRNIIG